MPVEVVAVIKVLLWERREERRMTLRELSERSGLSKSTLQRIECRKRSPTLRQLDRIAKALNVNITQLFTWDKE